MTDTTPPVDLSVYEHASIGVAPRAQQLIEACNRAVADSPETLAKCADLDRMVAAALKAADDERDSWVRPLNTVVRRFNERFKTITGPLTEKRRELQGKMLAYQREQNRIAAEKAEAERRQREQEAIDTAARLEREAVEAAARAADAKEKGWDGNAQGAQREADAKAAEATLVLEEAADAPPPPPPPVITQVRGAYGSVASFGADWKYEVVDIAKVPREWMQVNDKMIRAAIRGKDGIREIGGLRIFDAGRITNR